MATLCVVEQAVRQFDTASDSCGLLPIHSEAIGLGEFQLEFYIGFTLDLPSDGEE